MQLFNVELRRKWRYYMDEAEQEAAVAEKLKEIRRDYAKLQPEEITLLDPCMGSGHILVYAFDVLMDIYRSVGYTDRDAAASIVEHNLYGLDIDDRAAQLAYFAVMMKACDYDRRFLRRGVQPKVFAIQESRKIDDWKLDGFGGEKPLAKRLLNSFMDAKEYGSILHVKLTLEELARLRDRMEEMRREAQETLTGMADNAEALAAVEPLLEQAEILARKYDAVITNPPYMGSSGMNEKLAKFVKENYPDSKSDLFAVFIERCGELLDERGYQAMITQHAWMFLSSYEGLRGKLQKQEIINMAHLGARAFEEIGGEVVQTTAFVLQKTHRQGYKGSYARLIEPTTQDGKEEMFLAETNRYSAQQENFTKIPGCPIAYWVSEKVLKCFESYSVSNYGWASKGIITGNNEKYLREWYEVNNKNINFNTNNYMETLCLNYKWYPCNKGGEFRKWYGNNEYVINWFHNGEEIMQRNVVKTRNCQDYKDEYKFVQSITWTSISSSKPSFRLSEKSLSESAGMTLFLKKEEILQILAGLNSKVTEYLLSIENPTLNYTAGSIASLPVIRLDNTETMNGVKKYTAETIDVSKDDWDSFETSWDFKKHPLI